MASYPQKPTTFPNIEAHLNRLRQLNTQDIQSQWRQSGEMPVADVFDCQGADWAIAPLNEKQHIAWSKGRHILWLYQSIVIPNTLNGYPLSGLILRLALTWWADDAQIYVDKELVQSGDLFECFTRLCLSKNAIPGQTIQVAIRLVSPGHDDGALVRSQLIYELPSHYPTPEPSFVADELTILATLEPESQPRVENAIAQLNWNSLNTEQQNTEQHEDPAALNIWETFSNQPIPIPAITHPFQQSLSTLRRSLLDFSPLLKQRQIQCVGHAHLDMAWLWPIADTWNAAERTFKSILNLQKDFPHLTYTHSSPALFEWIENNRPALFKQIQEKVKEGTWSIDAGLWIEPEFNIISGESIVRQILYGQRYCQEKFGQISKIAWLPDSFGFCWQLPQLLIQGGIETFATLKLSWNDTTEFPYKLFWWQSPDGSQILSIMLPPIGTDIDPVKMATHTSNWENTTKISDALWLPGLGDHGGGPTKDMLEKSQRWEKSPFFPTLTFTSPKKYINNLPIPPSPHPPTPPLPVWQDELYLELHRGCYTAHADQKTHNRRCEDLLYQAEVFATIAYLKTGQTYPKTDIETAWKALLFNQFHDILPGTSIPEVFADAEQTWNKVYEIGRRVLDKSLSAIAQKTHLPNPPHPEAKPFIVFNSLSWACSAVITVNLPTNISSSSWQIYNSNQELLPSQIHTAQNKLSFQADNLPAVGYRYFWLYPNDSTFNVHTPENYILDNTFLTAKIDPKTGCISSLIEKATQTETFSAPGNQLQAFQDKGQYWDAWNIDPDYAKHPLPKPELQSVQWLENGSIFQQIQVIYHFQKSTIKLYYSLAVGSPYIEVEAHIDWQEEQVLLKTYFPLTISSDTVTYEIPFGAITRSTSSTTKREKAKWEVPALRWANLGSSTFGTSILTNGKHGFDASQKHLRLTLLKSPIWPDPQADKGQHHFTYAIYPHAKTWQTAHTVRHAKEFSIKPLIHWPTNNTQTKNTSSSSQSFLHIHNNNIILSALKPSESNADEIIMRFYESHGKAATLQITDQLGLRSEGGAHRKEANLLETPIIGNQPNEIKPWQVATYRSQNPPKKEKPS